MGPVPLSHLEILAWQINMRRTLEPGEISMLVRLSKEWIAETDRAEDPDCPAPWLDQPAIAIQRARMTANMRASLHGAGQ